MKRFTAVLIIAVLALGCVFAASTGDSSNNVVNVNSANKVIVYTEIDRIYPVFQIIAYTSDTEPTSGYVTGGTTSANRIEGKKNYDATTGNETVSVKVAIQHYGLANNETGKGMVNIRYRGSVKVTVTATSLKNTGYGDSSSAQKAGHVYETLLQSATKFADVNALKTYCEIKPSDAYGSTMEGADMTTSITAVYKNGTVLTGAEAKTIANDCTFTWDTTNLTPGDKYEATITIAYETV